MSDSQNQEASVLAEKWLAYKRDVEKLRPRSVDSYAFTIDKFLTWWGDRPLTELTFEDVDDFTNRPVRAPSGGTRQASDSTVRAQVATMRAFFKYLVQIVRYPLSESATMVVGMRAERLATKKPKPAADDKWLALWLSPLAPDDRVWLGLGYFLGFRAIEMMSVRPEDFALDRGMVEFQRKGREGNLHRLNLVSVIEDDLRPHLPHVGPFDPFLEALEWQVKVREGMRFLNPATQGENVEVRRNRVEWMATSKDSQWVHRRLDILCRDFGLPRGAEGFSPHQLRHSAATNLYRAGVDLLRMADIMHHGSIETTRMYAGLTNAFDLQRQRNMHGVPPAAA